MFLSHLSGDEAATFGLPFISFFLSHLSGDEVSIFITYLDDVFLSHLSGDEAISNSSRSPNTVSKSPER